MGGRGAKSSVATGKVIPFPTASSGTTVTNNQSDFITTDNWDYRGNQQEIDKLNSALDSARSVRKVQSVGSALKRLDSNISKQLDDIRKGNDVGDERTLLSQRRKVRLLLKKAERLT